MFRSDNLDPYGAYLENGYDSPYADESLSLIHI